MAVALRKVTKNYDWTLKRADNDLHNVVTPRPQTPPPGPPSHLDIKPVIDSSGAFPWDANHFRLKFWTDYEELREHLGRSLLILLSICRLLMVATTHFVGHHISSVIHLHEERIKLAGLDVYLTSIWSLFVSFFRSAASLIISLLWEIICFSIPRDMKTYAKKGSGTRFLSWLSGQWQSPLALVSVEGLKGLSIAQSCAKNMGNTRSDRTQSQLQVTTSLADNLKVGIMAVHTMVNDEARRLFT